MSATHPKFKAAAVQAAPVFMDLDGTVEKTIGLIHDAANAGAKLVAFPECWIPGYPLWAWTGPPVWGMQFVQRYHDNCLVVGSPEMQRIQDAANEANIAVMLGFSERDRGSLYISQAFIERDGALRFARRKLKPTHVERAVFGEGDGSDFYVVDTEFGRVGGLCCWEHLQPLSRYAMFSEGEQVHVSAWPAFGMYPGLAYALGAEINLRASQNYAFEGQCFVLASTLLVDQAVIDLLIDSPDKTPLLQLGGGASKIFAPDGQQISEDLPHDQEGLVFADIDLGMISLAKAVADPAGHYSRPDVTQLLVNREKRSPVRSIADAQNEAKQEPASEPSPGTPPNLEIVARSS